MQGDNGRLRVVARDDADRPGALPPSGAIDGPSPGRFLREQRKRRGLSIEQLAAATKIPRRSLEMLEEDRYDALPGPVFVKGFIRCVARSLGVEVQAVMDLLYERERAAIASKRTGRPVPAPTPMPAAEAGAGRAAPRRAKVAAATPSWADAVRGRLPSPAVFLWVVVAAFVAAVVLAAFNLVGGGPAGAS